MSPQQIAAIVRVLVRLATRVSVHGASHVPSQGALIVAINHLSWADPPVIVGTFPRMIRFMAKEELWRNPVLAWLGRHHGDIQVRRGEADRQAIRDADAVLRAGDALAIMPEGTRSRSGMLKDGKSGVAFLAYRNDVPILPVGVWGSEVLQSPAGFLRRPKVNVAFGKPFRLDPANRKRLDAATEQIMFAIADCLPERYRGRYSTIPENAGAVPT